MIPVIAPLWIESLKIHIEQDKIQAKTLYKRLPQMLSIESAAYYIDENGINQKVGTAAVQLSQEFSNISIFLGSNKYYTVYATKLSRILVTIHMVLVITLISPVRKILIFTNNQSAFWFIYEPRKSFGQAIIQDILGVIQKLQGPDIDTKLYLVLPHLEISRNEKTDIAAKKSTGWRIQTKRNGRQIEIDTDKTAHQI